MITYVTLWVCPKVSLHLQNCDISHSLPPRSLYICPIRVCFHVVKCLCCLALCFWLTFEQRTVPLLCNITTGLHSSRRLMSQALILLIESQEPEVVSDQFNYMFCSNKTTKMLSGHHTFLVFFSTSMWGMQDRFPCRNRFAISLVSWIIWRVDGKLKSKVTMNTSDVYIVNN